MNRSEKKEWPDPSMNRRTFMKVSGTLAAWVIGGPLFTKSRLSATPLLVTGENPADAIETAEDIIYSVCQMCHSRCGLRAKVKEGILLKLDGNPYHPNNRDVNGNERPDISPLETDGRLPYDTPPEVAFRSLGRMCLKGQSGIQTLYDPYRIQHPLKRVGPRNSGKWMTISWEQAFSEIAAKINLLIPPMERD